MSNSPLLQQSPLFPEGSWLLCAPNFYDVAYEINPWMNINRGPQQAVAALQWTKLHHTILRLGGWIEYVHPSKAQPDMVFTANAGLVRGKKVVLARFKHPERQGEAPLFHDWFKEHGFEVHVLKDYSFEGEGDALFAGETLFAGYGIRTDRDCYTEVAKVLEVSDVVLCELTDPYFYHLDTCFCPLDATRGIFHSKAFTPESVSRMRSKLDLFDIPDEDAKKFACNAVVLGKQVIIPAGCAATRAYLESIGLAVYEVELTEFIKAGGAAKCLSLRLQQRS